MLKDPQKHYWSSTKQRIRERLVIAVNKAITVSPSMIEVNDASGAQAYQAMWSSMANFAQFDKSRTILFTFYFLRYQYIPVF